MALLQGKINPSETTFVQFLPLGRGRPEKIVAGGQLGALGCEGMTGVRLMELVLHIGAHRTATTAFQKFLEHNAAALAAEKVTALGSSVTRAGLLTGLMCHPRTSNAEKDRRAHRACGLLHLMLAEKQRGGFEQVILSEPNLLGGIAENVKAGYLYPSARGRLMRARSGFTPNLKRIVLSIRSYETWWASQLAVSVAIGHALPDEGTLDRLVTQPRRWRMLIKDIQDVFPRTEILVLPYERIGAQPERTLALISGVCIPSVEHQARDQHAMAPTVQYLRKIVNDRGETPKSSNLFNVGSGHWRPFPTGHSEALKEAYADDLAWLRDQDGTGITFIDDQGQTPNWEEDLRGQDDGFEEECAIARSVGTTGRERIARPPA